jgi:hypothetical protein
VLALREAAMRGADRADLEKRLEQVLKKQELLEKAVQSLGKT